MPIQFLMSTGHIFFINPNNLELVLKAEPILKVHAKTIPIFTVPQNFLWKIILFKIFFHTIFNY